MNPIVQSPLLSFLSEQSRQHRAAKAANKNRIAAAVAQDKANAAQLTDNAAKYSMAIKIAALVALAVTAFAIFKKG